MTDLIRPLLAGFETAHFSVDLQLSDLKNADAVRRARGDSGASISWVVGHILSFRYAVLRECGVEQADPYEEKFSFQSPATDGNDYPDIAKLRKDWNDVHTKLRDTLSSLTEERLLGKSDLPSPHGEQTLLDALSFFTWHEAYHVGVIGLLRVQWGYRHTHEMAMEAMGKASAV